MLRTLLFWIIALVAFFCGLVTSLQLAEFLSAQAVNSSSSFLGVVFVGGACSGPFFLPVLWDLLLMALFVLQHSGMASAWWKRKMFNWDLQPIDRSVYILATSLALQWIMSRWDTLPGPAVWFIDTSERPLLWAFFFVLHVVCWVTVYGAALIMDFPELMGIKQVYYLCNLDADHPMLHKARTAQKFYKHMRHSGVLCIMIILWVHPIMTVARLFLGLVWSLYLIFGHRVNDQDYIYLKEQMRKKSASLRQNFGLLN